MLQDLVEDARRRGVLVAMKDRLQLKGVARRAAARSMAPDSLDGMLQSTSILFAGAPWKVGEAFFIKHLAQLLGFLSQGAADVVRYLPSFNGQRECIQSWSCMAAACHDCSRMVMLSSPPC
jgi:hypothetical protein